MQMGGIASAADDVEDTPPRKIGHTPQKRDVPPRLPPKPSASSYHHIIGMPQARYLLSVDTHKLVSMCVLSIKLSIVTTITKMRRT